MKVWITRKKGAFTMRFEREKVIDLWISFFLHYLTLHHRRADYDQTSPKQPEACLSFRQKGDDISVEERMVDDPTSRFGVQDNGAGISPVIDWKNPGTLDLRLVNSLVTQLNGSIELGRTDGRTVTLMAPLKKILGMSN